MKTEFLLWTMKPAMPSSCWGAGDYRKFRIIEVEQGHRPGLCRHDDTKIKKIWETKPLHKGKYFPFGRCAASLGWQQFQTELFFLQRPRLTIRELEKISRSHEWEFIRQACRSEIEERRARKKRA